MKLIKLILILIVIISLTISFVPLNLYYDKVSQNIRPVKLENIEGSAIKGSAQSLKYLGLELGQVKWLVYPSSYNEVTLDFKLKSNDYDVSGMYLKNPESDVIKDFSGTFDWSLVADKVNFKHGSISGYFLLDFQKIELRGGVPERIVGRVTSKDLKLIKPIQMALGEIEVVFTSESPSIIVGQVNSKSDVLNVSGAIYIHKNHRWEVKLNLIPKAGQYEMDYALQGIGYKRRGGGRTLNLAGFY